MSKSKKQDVTGKEEVCRNCETQFVGNYCPHCGQSTKEFVRPFNFLIIDLMGNIFAFDTRFWKTLKAVVFKPGILALEFVNGHRVRYMPPFRFYVFVSFIFFLLMNFYVSRSYKNQGGQRGKKSVFVINETVDSTDTHTITFFGRSSDEVLDKDSVKSSILGDSINSDNTNSEIDNVIDIDSINSHPALYIGNMFKYLSWSVFLLMPFYGFLLWLFYRKKQPFYITNLILAINQHSFAFVIFIFIALLSFIIPGDVESYGNFILFIVPLYTFIGLKRLYKQKWWATLLKMAGMGIFYFVVLMCIIMVITLLAFEIYVFAA